MSPDRGLAGHLLNIYPARSCCLGLVWTLKEGEKRDPILSMIKAMNLNRIVE